MEINKYVQSGVDYQYRQHLVSVAIQQCEDGEDTTGYAAKFLRDVGICSECYKNFDIEMLECRNPECISCFIFPSAHTFQPLTSGKE